MQEGETEHHSMIQHAVVGRFLANEGGTFLGSIKWQNGKQRPVKNCKQFSMKDKSMAIG
jgi:hypothetical protein